jgi:hypothetical protein
MSTIRHRCGLLGKARKALLVCSATTLWLTPDVRGESQTTDELRTSIPATLVFAGSRHDRLQASVKDDPKIPRTFLPAQAEVDVPLHYADYYFLEALLRYLDLDPAKS